jgi:hypothetical protein
MPIRVEHQPSPAVVGMAAYYAGYAGRKKREQEQFLQNRMTLYRDAQQQQARREGQAADFMFSQELNRQHATAADARLDKTRRWDVKDAEKGFAEDRAAEDDRFLSEKYKALTDKLDAIVAEGGG